MMVQVPAASRADARRAASLADYLRHVRAALAHGRPSYFGWRTFWMVRFRAMKIPKGAMAAHWRDLDALWRGRAREREDQVAALLAGPRPECPVGGPAGGCEECMRAEAERRAAETEKEEDACG